MIRKFALDLANAFERGVVPRNVKTEGDFERHFAIPVACRLVKRYPAISLFIHPWGNSHCCSPRCSSASPEGRVLGCPTCWKASKKWATVATFGTEHTFDMVARDRSKTLAVEIKLVDARGTRRPNGAIQRFLGQCSLAATMHDEVIGVCGVRGTLNDKYQRNRTEVENHFSKQNVRLVFRQVP